MSQTPNTNEPSQTSVRPISVVSLFAGCGGMDLGFLGDFAYLNEHFPKLPFNILQAYDKNSRCVTTYQRNIGDHIIEADLAEYDIKKIPEADVLIGGFPCQDFSSCGPQKGLSSERGQLYKVFISYMERYSPAVVVAENVPNLERMQEGEVFRTIKNDLANVAPGYNFNVWKLYAPDYGVPQTRKRLFFVGVRSDLESQPIIPPKTHPEYRSAGMAIRDLEDVTDDQLVPNQSQYFKAKRAKKGNGQGDEKTNEHKPAYTVRANAKSRIQFHYKLDRRLTVRECARIQTFPDTFTFPFAATTNIMQIGNAVPPILGYRVAESIAQYVREHVYSE